MKNKHATLLIILFLFLTGGVYASGLMGTITNPDESTIPDLDVILISSTADTQIVTTDKEGFYEFASTVMPGFYTLVIITSKETLKDTMTFLNDWDFLIKDYVLANAVVSLRNKYNSIFNRDKIRDKIRDKLKVVLTESKGFRITSLMPGDYKLSITSVRGKVLKSYTGNGPFDHVIALNRRQSGFYIVALRQGGRALPISIIRNF